MKEGKIRRKLKLILGVSKLPLCDQKLLGVRSIIMKITLLQIVHVQSIFVKNMMGSWVPS